MRVLPPDLVSALTRARDLEAVALEAGGPVAHQRAIRGTGALILAAVELGWRVAEVAATLPMSRQAVGYRLRDARQLYGDDTPALVFDAPLDHPPHPRAVLQQPVQDREWLTAVEAAQFAGVHRFTIRNWSLAGLLPNTDRTYRPHLFLRADLVRVQRGPRYKAHGVSYSQMRTTVRALGR